MDVIFVVFCKEMIFWKNVFSSVFENLKFYDKIDIVRYLIFLLVFFLNFWFILLLIVEFNFFLMCDCSWLIFFE